MILRTAIIRRLFGAIGLLVGATSAAWATDYSDTLDFSESTVTAYNEGLAGVDIDRIDLGSALSGSAVDFSLTVHEPYNLLYMLGIIFTSDPNEALYANPGVLADLITSGANFDTVLNANVTGLQAYMFGRKYIKEDGPYISSRYSPSLNSVAGTHRYAFVAGGSLLVNGDLVDSSVGYTLSVVAVAEPESYALMLAGLGLVGAVARKRIKTVN